MKVMVVLGTRPEVIKLASVIKELKADQFFDVKVCLTGQHKKIVEQMIDIFKLPVDLNLEVMQENQSLTGLTSKIMAASDRIIAEEEPDLVIVQGDTNTTFAIALSAFYQQIPVGYVEAGLRTYDKKEPFPEEMNRILTTRISDFLFAPTEWSKNNLLKEGVEPHRIFMTGNTVVDGLQMVLAEQSALKAARERFSEQVWFNPDQKMILMTCHRRENQGENLISICTAVKKFVEMYEDYCVVYPVHPNPNVKDVVEHELAEYDRIHLIDPVDYLEFISLMQRAEFILSDSGGVQEEAPTIGKTVLILRDKTERPEAIQSGNNILVGTNAKHIFAMMEKLVQLPAKQSDHHPNPYGEGDAAEKIVKILKESFHQEIDE